ncbi:hypothetical protein D8911_14655 (plasmid) [Levilactobacillus brevis]|nr:hypothetical protein D8911_14655 [Levilactobacillus brevis]
MTMQPAVSTSFIESELNRINQKPLSQYLDHNAHELEKLLCSTEREGLANQFPCPCCTGAGFLYIAGDLFAFNMEKRALKPVQTSAGSNIRTGHVIRCPRCDGSQFDMLAWVQSQLEAVRGVAA